MTDTIDPYPSNNKSSFTVTFYKSDYEYEAGLFLVFYHFFHTDTLTDSAYVDFSYDGGESWHIGLDQSDIFLETFYERYFLGYNYGYGGRVPILSGNSGGWVREQYSWAWYHVVKKNDEEFYYPDSIIVRFNFISDSLQTSKDGWMVDDINIYKWGGSGIELNNSSTILVYPNPADKYISVKSINPIQDIILYSPAGQIIMLNQNVNLQNNLIDIEELKPGLYILEFRFDDGLFEKHKVLKY
jgi:hypothetical protein